MLAEQMQWVKINGLTFSRISEVRSMLQMREMMLILRWYEALATPSKACTRASSSSSIRSLLHILLKDMTRKCQLMA